MKALKHIIILHSDEEKKLCWAEVCVIVFSQERTIQSIYSYVYSRVTRVVQDSVQLLPLFIS